MVHLNEVGLELEDPPGSDTPVVYQLYQHTVSVLGGVASVKYSYNSRIQGVFIVISTNVRHGMNEICCPSPGSFVTLVHLLPWSWFKPHK